jgi:hypothetical protein
VEERESVRLRGRREGMCVKTSTSFETEISEVLVVFMMGRCAWSSARRGSCNRKFKSRCSCDWCADEVGLAALRGNGAK